MITLGGVALSDGQSDMIWVERYAHQQGEQTIQRTLGGNAVIYAGGVNGGIPITLRATSDRGWLRRSVVEQLIALADVPDARYVLSFDSDPATVMNVVFRHVDSPAIDMTPLRPRTKDSADDYMTGDIKLMTVGS